MKINKMDNNMTAIVSVMMITLGFVNGLIITSVYNSVYVDKLHNALNQATDTMFEKDQQIDKLKEDLENEKDLNIDLIKKLSYEKQRCADILESVKTVVSDYDSCLPRIDAPRGPLKRSRRCLEIDTESDSEFVPPTSPEPVVSSKD